MRFRTRRQTRIDVRLVSRQIFRECEELEATEKYSEIVTYTGESTLKAKVLGGDSYGLAITYHSSIALTALDGFDFESSVNKMKSITVS